MKYLTEIYSKYANLGMTSLLFMRMTSSPSLRPSLSLSLQQQEQKEDIMHPLQKID